jgi:hypothetical protein
MANCGIVFIFFQNPNTTDWHYDCLAEALSIAEKNTNLPICLCTESSLAERYQKQVDKLYISPNHKTVQELRITMSNWVPFEAWLYLDYDAKIIGNDIDFGFSMLDKGYDCAVCSITCEADKSCIGDSVRYPDIKKVREDVSRFIFYPQLGIIYQRRSKGWVTFEKQWLQTHKLLYPHSEMLQPSFAVTYYDFGVNLKLYVLPPHFNCRKGFKELNNGVELPVSHFPRDNIQIIHDRLWYSKKEIIDDAI